MPSHIEPLCAAWRPPWLDGDTHLAWGARWAASPAASPLLLPLLPRGVLAATATATATATAAATATATATPCVNSRELLPLCQQSIGVGCADEIGLGALRIAEVSVRVVGERNATKRRTDRHVGGAAGDAEYLVRIFDGGAAGEGEAWWRCAWDG